MIGEALARRRREYVRLCWEAAGRQHGYLPSYAMHKRLWFWLKSWRAM